MNLSEPEINTAINQARILTEWAYAEMSKEQPTSELTQNRMVYIDKLLSSLMPGVLAQAQKLAEENSMLTRTCDQWNTEYDKAVQQLTLEKLEIQRTVDDYTSRIGELAESRNYYIDYNETLRATVTDVVKFLTPKGGRDRIGINAEKKALTTLTACLDSND